MPHLFSHHHSHEEGDAHSSESPHHHIGHHRDGSNHSSHGGHGNHHTASTQTSASGRARGTDDNPLQPQYKEALPSRLDAKFHGQPVTGTAIIVDELPEFMRNESEFELVTPQRTTVLETFAQVTLEEGQRTSSVSDRDSSRGMPTPSAQSQESDGNAFSSHGTGSVPRSAHHKHHDKKVAEAQKLKEAKLQKEREAHPHQVLNGGGYIIFSDKYLREHPESRVTDTTRKYSTVNPPPSSYPELDPSLTEEKQKTEKAKYLIEQSEGDYRPLFRKRNSSLVYGRATYEASDASYTDSCVSPGADTASQEVVTNPGS